MAPDDVISQNSWTNPLVWTAGRHCDFTVSHKKVLIKTNKVSPKVAPPNLLKYLTTLSLLPFKLRLSELICKLKSLKD